MKTNFFARAFPLFLITLGLLGTGTLRGELQIERLQRDFQVRYQLFTNDWLHWPQCSAGNSPAPAFPKNGFYGDLSQDPDKAVEVVSNLVHQFYVDHIIYTNFVAATNGYSDLQGVSSIVTFTDSDMPLIQATNVTAQNYAQIAQTLATNLAKLQLVKVQASQVVAVDGSDTKITYAESLLDCSTTEACSTNHHAGTSWGHWRKYGGNCDLVDDQAVNDISCKSWTNIAVEFESLKLARAYAISNWPTVQAQMSSDETVTGFDSSFPTWDGVFDTVFHSPLHGFPVMWEFVDQSLPDSLGNPKIVSPSELPGWPDGDWANSFTYTELYRVGNTWNLLIETASENLNLNYVIFWWGNFNGGDADHPDGVYIGNAYGQNPPTLTIVPTNITSIATSRTTRGKIKADLTRFAHGSVKVFLKLQNSCDESWLQCSYPSYPCTNNFAGNPPSGAPEGKYGQWTNGLLTLGTVSTTDNYVPEPSATPSALGACPSFARDLYGWSVADAVAIVAPDFKTTDDRQECCSCTTICEAGAITPTLASIHIDIPLGADNFSGSAGALTLSADVPSLALATPAALRYSKAANVEFTNNADGPLTHLQFKSSQVLSDIQTNNDFKYTISFYTASDAGSQDTNGFYQPIGSPFRIITIENPEETTNSFNQLRITSIDGTTNITDYIYASTTSTTNASETNTWEMITGNGLRGEIRTSVWTNQTDRTETVMILNANSNLVYKELNFWHLYPWGQERLTNVVDPDGAKLTNFWVFYDNPTNDGASYRLLHQEADANGHWTLYQYDQYGRETNRITQFLSETNTAANLNRASATIYGTNAPQITTIESLLGTEISRRYQIVTSGEVQNIQCQTRGAAINASDNLTNITKKYTSGSFAGQLKSVRNPNGTVQIYLYSTNATQKATVVLSGVPAPGSDTNILSGTITTTVTMLGGQVLTNLVMYRQSGASDTLIARDTYTYTDTRNRSYYVVHLDGTTNQYNYGCCALDNEVDREGILTQYFYDALKRQTASVRNGITTSNILDPNGSVLATIRIGTNGSQIVQRQQLFDVAGRVTRETNALNGVTVYTNFFDSAHQLVRKTTFPNYGTRFETNAQDGALVAISGTAAQPMSYLYGADSDGAFTTERKLDDSGGTNEWTRTSTDMAGRAYKTVFAAASGTPLSISYFNTIGQLTNTIDPDGVSTLLGYNEKGEQTLSVLDSNRNYSINFSGTDRITLVTNDVTSTHGTTVRRTQTYVWKTSADSKTLLSTAETSVDGLQSWNTIWNNGSPVTSHSQTSYDPAHGLRVVTSTGPDSSYTVTSNQFGRAISVGSFDSLNSQLSGTSYAYDAHGRQSQLTDARNGSTTLYFNSTDQTSGAVTPAPSVGQSAQTTTNFFDNMGRVVATKLPDNTYISNKFDLTGMLTNTFGSRTYPVSYTYDAQGRMKTMKTWKNFSANSGPATTTWVYDGYRGWLTNKTYDGNTPGPRYTYTAAGRLASRLWARGTNTTYSYNNAGDLSSISYNDGATSGITYDFDRRGRQTTITSGSTTCSFSLDDAGDLLSEAYSGGPLSSLTVSNRYDQFLRRTNMVVQQSSNALIQQSFTYDAASRLKTVMPDANNTIGYSYLANSPLVSQIGFTNSGTRRMVTTKQFDLLNRLTNINTLNSQPLTINSFTYTINSANQRTSRTEADAAYWSYSYDAIGQVISGKKYWSDGTPVAGQQFEYSFDDIGNRQSSKQGGDQWGANLRSATYNANNLNQYTSRTVPGYVNDIGTANSNATVTLWNSDVTFAPTYRHGDYFRAELPTTNGSVPLWLTLTNLAVLNNGTNADIITNSVGNIFVPKTPETFGFDLDGNQTNDGRWTMTWDAENRLTTFISISGAPSPSLKKIVCSYDYLGRRVQKIVYDGSSLAYIPISTNKYIYDGWNLVAILDVTNGLVSSFAWGTDLSGSVQGAGGVGGLLSMTVYSGANSGTYFCTYDGNGNVSALVSGSDGGVAAQYEYGPFGEIIRATGPAAEVNPFRFSAKYQDKETDLLYYGYRYYNPITGRWLSRDPIGEEGGQDPYGFVGNCPEGYTDLLGLQQFKVICDKAADLDLRIQRLRSNTGDAFKRIFMGVQLCILKKLCKGSCCTAGQSAAWLNGTIDTFMTQFTDALDGKYYPENQRWKPLLEQIDKLVPLTPRPEDMLYFTMGTPAGGSSLSLYGGTVFSDHVTGVDIARQMAFVHINQDLDQALRKNTPGLDSDWNCVGGAVAGCEGEFFTKLEQLIGKLLPKERFNIAFIRERMRDRIKQELGQPVRAQ